MEIFLSIQNTYQELQIGLFEGQILVDIRTQDKRLASKDFVPLLQDLLIANNRTLDEIQFIAVNQGPGPFSTLRVVIASANGLSFASNIPLVGVDGLDAFLQEYHNDQYPNTVVLLNAFNFDVYYAIKQKNQTSKKGYKKIDLFLKELVDEIPNEHIRFLGGGVSLYEKEIRSTFGDQAIIPEPLAQHCSISQVGLTGLELWEKNKSDTNQVLPLYLKKHNVELKK